MVPGYSSGDLRIGVDVSSEPGRTVIVVRTGNPNITGGPKFLRIAHIDSGVRISIGYVVPEPALPPPQIENVAEDPPPRKVSWQQKQRELPNFLREKRRNGYK